MSTHNMCFLYEKSEEKSPELSPNEKMSCILHHRGIQMILAYSLARPATLAAGNDRGGMF